MATGTTEFIDITTADAAIPEIWSKYSIVARESKLVWAERVDRKYERELNMGDTLHIFNVSNLTVQTKNTSANAATIYETVTEANKDLTVGTWHYQALAIETAARKQINRNLLETYGPKQHYALALAVDDVLAGLPDDFSNSVGTLAVELTYEDLLRAVQYLDDADVPQDGRTIVISPAQKAGFMKMDQFIHGDYSKLNANVKVGEREAYLGSWMGIPVYVSTNVEGTNGAGHDGALFHKDALALVMQMSPTVHNFFDIDYFAYKVAVEQLSGSGEIRDDHGVWLKSA